MFSFHNYNHIVEVIRLISSCCAVSSAHSQTFSALSEACSARILSTAHTRISAFVLDVNKSLFNIGKIILLNQQQFWIKLLNICSMWEPIIVLTSSRWWQLSPYQHKRQASHQLRTLMRWVLASLFHAVQSDRETAPLAEDSACRTIIVTSAPISHWSAYTQTTPNKQITFSNNKCASNVLIGWSRGAQHSRTNYLQHVMLQYQRFFFIDPLQATDDMHVNLQNDERN